MASPIGLNAPLHLPYDFSMLPAEMLTKLFLDYVTFSDLPSVLSTCRVFYQIVHQDPRVQALGEEFRKICPQKEQDPNNLPLGRQMNSFSLYHQLTHEQLTTHFPVTQSEWIKRAQSLKGQIHSQPFVAGHGKLTALIIDAYFDALKRIPFQIERAQRSAKIDPLEALSQDQPIVKINTQLTAVALELTTAHFENSCVVLKKNLQELVELTQLLPPTSLEEIDQVASFRHHVEALQWNSLESRPIIEMITSLENVFKCRMTLLKEQILRHTHLIPPSTIHPFTEETFTNFCTAFNHFRRIQKSETPTYWTEIAKMQKACKKVNPMITSLGTKMQERVHNVSQHYAHLGQVHRVITRVFASPDTIKKLGEFSNQSSDFFVCRRIAVLTQPANIQQRGTLVQPALMIWRSSTQQNHVDVFLIDDATGQIVQGGVSEENRQVAFNHNIMTCSIQFSSTLDTQPKYRLGFRIAEAVIITDSFSF